jgi:hypothetical protein
MFTLPDVLAVARIHPFYDEHVQCAPDAKAISEALHGATTEPPLELDSFPLLTKKNL